MVQLTQGLNNLRLNTSIPPPWSVAEKFQLILTSETTHQSKAFTLNTTIAGNGWDTRCLSGNVTINDGAENKDDGVIKLEEPNFPAGFYQLQIGQLNPTTFVYDEIGRGRAYVNRTSTERGYVSWKEPTIVNTIKAYEQ